MGIYLPNMEMPRKGQMLVIFPDGTSYVCFNGMRERLTQTTAVPVPPHGRLIDADAILQEATKGEEPFDWIDKNELLRLFFDAPTILEAEEGE